MLKNKLKKFVAFMSVLLLLCLELSMFDDFFYPFRFFWDQGKIVELLLLSALFVWSLLGALLLFFSGRSLFRTVTLPFFLFFLLFNLAFYTIANAPLDFQQAVIIVENFRWWFWAVVENFGLAALPGILILVPLILLIERLPDLSTLRFPKQAYWVPVSTLLLVFFATTYTHGLFDRYHSFFRVPSMLLLAAQSDLFEGERAGVAYQGRVETDVEKIVLIVDESIRADLLGVNGYRQNTTPYLNTVEGGFVNFGLASSSSNCSDYANLLLRTGIKKEAIPDEKQMSLKQPSIWQFTKKAGYYNVYLDAQSAPGWDNYQNFMNGQEAVHIDELIRLRQEVAYESDGVARERLANLLKQPGKTFIILNKYGIHFPYFRSYPEASAFFTPVLAPGEPMNDREKSLNSYMNGVRWSVDAWFKALLSDSESFRPYLIIYTSDHGQNIVDDGTLATHCRPGANRFEGIVPMMVFSNDPVTLQKARTALTAGYNRTSHFQIFPTLIRSAGYEEGWVNSRYGPPLDAAPATQPEFFVGDLYGRGSIRKWVPIFPVEAGNSPIQGE